MDGNQTSGTAMHNTVIDSMDSNKYGSNSYGQVGGPSDLNTNSERPFTSHCAYCNLSFESGHEFEHHIGEMHSLPRHKLTCDLCTATFTRQDHLKRHMISFHSNQKYCKCPVCERDFPRQDILQKHIKKKHATTGQIFNCRECPFKCTSLENLENHENTHTVSSRHICPQCDSTFKRRDHMLRHIKSQHLNMFVVCQVCSQKYKRRDHLTRHMREKHNIHCFVSPKPQP